MFLISFLKFILFHLILQGYYAFVSSLFDFCLQNVNFDILSRCIVRSIT